MESSSMKRNRVSAGRISGMSIVLLILASCSRSVAIGEPFVLREGKAVHVRGTELTVEAEEIIQGLDGSQWVDDGSVTLRVTVEGVGETELYLEAGEWTMVGEYEIRFERVVSGTEGTGCELIVNRDVAEGGLHDSWARSTVEVKGRPYAMGIAHNRLITYKWMLDVFGLREDTASVNLSGGKNDRAI
jgi:hypothetical protein